MLLEKGDVVIAEVTPDYDALVIHRHPFYAWRPDPCLTVNRDTKEIHWDGQVVGRYQTVGVDRRGPVADNFIAAGVRVVLLKAHKPTVHKKRDALKRLLAAVLLYKRVKETAAIPLVSRVSYKFVERL